jgi:hypothetical protein
LASATAANFGDFRLSSAASQGDVSVAAAAGSI